MVVKRALAFSYSEISETRQSFIVIRRKDIHQCSLARKAPSCAHKNY